MTRRGVTDASTSGPPSIAAVDELGPSSPDAPPIGRGIVQPRTIASFLIGAIVIGLFLWKSQLDYAAIWRLLRGANPFLLALSFVVYYCAFASRSLRWRVLLENVGYGRDSQHPLPSVLGLAEIIYLSWFANCVLPARLGDAYRGYLLKRASGVSFSVTIGTVVAERLLDISMLAAMMASAALFTLRSSLPDEVNRALVGGIVLTLAGIAGLLFMPRLRPVVEFVLPTRLHRHYAGLETGVLGSFKRVPLLLAFTTVNWLVEGLTLFILAHAVGAPVSVPAAIIVALVASLLSTVPFTPAGLGVAEAGIILALTQFGLDKNQAGAIALLDRVVTYWSIVFFGAILYAFSRKK